MSYDIPELLESLIGFECISVRINMDNNITIDLNDRDLEEWSDEDKANKGWKLMTESCAWRIIKDSMILCGHYDDAEDIIPVLNELIGAMSLNLNKLVLMIFLIIK